jgi:hypothetical protein
MSTDLRLRGPPADGLRSIPGDIPHNPAASAHPTPEHDGTLGGTTGYRSPEEAREPQWLGLSLPKNKRRGEERRRTCSTETYLCGSAPVQNFLLAPRNFAGVSSQGDATGGTGEGIVTKGPGRKTPGDGSFGRRGAPSTAFSRSVGDRPDDPHVAGYAVIGHAPRRCCLQPPGENGPRP